MELILTERTMKDKHTPGPWIVRDDEIQDVHGNTIADITEGGYWNTTAGMIYEDMPWEANARLMAAAPELLEILKESVWYIDFGDSGAIEWHEQMEKLIAKIEGNE